MMNGILTALLIFSVVTAAFTGRMEALSAAALSGCGEAVSLVITLTGMLCLWSGLMEIAPAALRKHWPGCCVLLPGGCSPRCRRAAPPCRPSA